MTLHSLVPGRWVLAKGSSGVFSIRVRSAGRDRSAADQLSALFDNLTRGLILEHRRLEAEYHLPPDRGQRLRVRDVASGRTMETPFGRDLRPGTENAHDIYAEALRLAVHLAPDEAYLVRALGDHYLAFRRFKEGIACFQGLIDTHPRCALLLFQLGMLYHRAGRKREAYYAFHRVYRLDPDDAVALYNLGIIAVELGHPHEAEDRFMASLARDPGMKAARARLDRLRRRGAAGTGFRLKTAAYTRRPDYTPR